MKYLKWTRKGRVPSYQGGQPIPYRKWTGPVTNPKPCRRGWHACRWEDAVHHVSDELWVCELRDPVVEGDDKVAASSLRLVRKTPLNERTLRLFAADCGEQVLPIFEKERPDDDRPRLAIQAARDYAEGRIRGAAGDAAWDAAWDAARAAARDAARAAAWAAARAAARDAARDAAWDAAWDAARAAAGAAAGDAARDAAREWQTSRLLCHYANLDPADFAHRGDDA